MARIVIAEDDPKQAEIVRRYLVADGHDVVLTGDGRQALDEIRANQPDLVVLDVMMPRLSGSDVCRALRTEPRTAALPVVMLTARASEDDLLDGLDLGADDYVSKPFSPRELVARVRALLRRSRRTSDDAGGTPIAVGALEVRPATREVVYCNGLVDCTRGEFTLLAKLAAEPGRVFTRDQLIGTLHETSGADTYVTRRTVDVHIANLRKKLDPKLIRTVYGVGYSLVVPR